MQLRRQTNQSMATPARKVGNILMGLGVATPIVGIAIVKMLGVIEYEIYPRVIQSIFIAALSLLIIGILVKNYWKGGQMAAAINAFDVWSDSGASASEKPFDWTGIGCSLFVLGPGLFFIVGMLFARDFEYAPFVGFGALILCMIVGNVLYRIGGRTRAAQLEAETRAQSALTNQSRFTDSTSATTGGIEFTGAANLPQIIPGHRPEGFVLVDNSQATSCGLIFFGFFTAIWYGITFIALYFVLTTRPDEGSTEGGVIALSLFLLAGLIPLSLFIRLARAGLAFEKQAELLLKYWPLAAGDEVEMNFRCGLRRNLTVLGIDVSLECKSTDKSGSETKTDTLDKRSLSVRELKQDGKSITGNWKIGMPTDWQLPYESPEQAIGWRVFVTVELAEGPKGVFSFPLLVVTKSNIETA
jgi:hypothetical protein